MAAGLVKSAVGTSARLPEPALVRKFVSPLSLLEDMENYPARLGSSDFLLNNLTSTVESGQSVNSLKILLLGFIFYLLPREIMVGGCLHMKIYARPLLNPGEPLKQEQIRVNWM